MEFETIAIIVVLSVAALCVLFALLRHYVFGRLMQKEHSVRATVSGKRCEVLSVTHTDNNIAHTVNDWSTPGQDGCLYILFFFLSAMPWKGLVRNGLDEPYRVQFDLGEKRKIVLIVSDSVYMKLNQGQEGLLTYKGNHFQRFRSLPTDKDGPVDVVEKPGS